ncbi:MAG: DUF4266 domain-containing protein [Betaproteobacteria bacterium]|nr:DUF4266 domain-containing protein [Betaproteobacteria bacterium]
MNKTIYFLVRLTGLLLLTLNLQACSGIKGAKPWEREYLAKPAMSIDAGSLDNRNLEHIYFSREGASGGWGIGGGGCGCN